MKQQEKSSSTEQSKYTFVQKLGDEFSCVKLTEGKFKNVIYSYKHVKFAPKENPDGRLPLKFTYDIQGNPDNADINCDEFKIYIGDILVEIIEQQLKNNQVIFKDGDKDIK